MVTANPLYAQTSNPPQSPFYKVGSESEHLSSDKNFG